MKKTKFLILLITIIMTYSLSFAQNPITFFGIIYDNETNEPVPYTNIILKRSKSGTISSAEGTFTIQTYKLPDTLMFSAMGYEPKQIALETNETNELMIKLQPKDFELEEIIVLPGENPAMVVMKNVIDYKEDNNPLRVKSYACNTYTKIMVNALRVNNDSMKLSGGMPIYFSEKVSQNIYQNDPYIEKGQILAEKQDGLGFLNEMNIIGYANNMSIELNFYDNVIEILDKPFISPLSNRAFSFYKFQMRDTITTDFGVEYIIDFKPKNKFDLAFKGYMKVIDEVWALSEIEAHVPITANLNYINKLRIKHTFSYVNDSLAFFKSNELDGELKITKDNALVDLDFTGILNKKTIYNNPIFNFAPIEPGQEEQIFNLLNPQKKQIIHKDLVKISRPEALSIKEINAIATIDSLNNSWKIRSADALSRMFITGYIPSDYFELGPYLELIKRNRVEGFRYTFTGRTSTNLTKNVMLYGHIGYGNRDQDWKYGLGMKYKLPSHNLKLITLEYRDDLSKVGDNGSIFLIKENMMVSGEDNVIASIFTNSPLDKLSREVKYKASYKHDFKRGVTGLIDLQNKEVYSGEFIPFMRDGTEVPSFGVNQLTLGLRLSWRENYTDNYCRRYYMNTKYPIVNIRVSGGQYELEGEYDEFLTLRGVVNHDINIGQTKLEYILETGMTLGTVPFPLLEVHRTDLSLGYALYSFNMMREMEFASDRFAAITAQYHLNSLIFNRVPMIKQLGFREVVSAKVLWSHLDDKHSQLIDYPFKFYQANRLPYVEVSTGVENVFQYFRFDVVWRLTHNQNPNTYPVGIRARFDVNF